MNPILDGIVEQALANEEAADVAAEEVKDVEQVNEEEAPSQEAQEQAEEASDEESGENEEDSGDSAEEVEEYSADELEYDEEPVEEKQPETIQGLTPEQSYIYNNLPDIKVLGADGKSYTIRTPSQLPEDFEFASKREELIFNQNIAAQELNARDLQNRFRVEEQNRVGSQFEEQIKASVREDVADLQNSGLFPKFKTPLDSPNFEKDPAVVEMQKVLDLMEERNAQYLAAAQKGAAFRYIGFKEAYDIYTAQEARSQRQSAVNNEDTARKNIAKQNSSSAGVREDSIIKPTVRPGTTTRDLLAEIENMEF